MKHVIGIVVFLLLCTAGVGTSVIRQKRTAQSFFSEAIALRLQTTSDAQVRQLAVRYGKQSNSLCTSENCSYFFSFDNGWLHHLHVAPYTRLTCTLTTTNGVLVSRRVDLVSGNPLGPYGAFVDERLSLHTAIEKHHSLRGLHEPFDVSRETAGQNSNIRWRVYVNLTPSATQAEHRIAYDLDLGCLSRIRGCEDARALLPSIGWGG
jgi:hypothetical protein